MARKNAPGTLIHCDTCGEDYSATYKRCPFCGEKADKFDTNRTPVTGEIPEDDYVFDGGDLFDDDYDEYDEDDSRPVGGKRLNHTKAAAPINWPRIITFICSLIIIAAALVIIFTYIYPKIHDPDATQSPGTVITDPDDGDEVIITDDPMDPVDPDNSGTGEITGDPDISTDDPDENTGTSAEPDGSGTSTEPVQESADSIQLNKVDFTLKPDEDYTIKATVSPASWSGTITWTSSNTSLATVDQNGTVTNVNTGNYLLPVTITATAGGQTATATVYCTGGSTPPQSSQPDGEAVSGDFKLNREDFTLVIGSDDTFQMKATGVDSVIWSVSDPSIATIDENGKVTAVSKGKTTITATAPDGSVVTCIVRVRGG